MIIIVLVLALAGLAVLNHSIKTAAKGYEDEFGFHEGSDPQTAGDFAAALHAEIIERVIESPHSASRTRRAHKRSAKKPAERGPAGPTLRIS